MKTVMKKLLSVMLVALLLVSAVPFQASADEANTVKIDIYEVDNDNNATMIGTAENVNLDAYENNDAMVADIYDGQWQNYKFKNFGDGTAMLQIWPMEAPEGKEIVTLTLVFNNGTSDKVSFDVYVGDNILDAIKAYGVQIPAYADHTFNGWSFNHTTETSGEAGYVVNYLHVIEGDTTLYADWSKVSDDDDDNDDVVYDAVLKIYVNGKTSSAAKTVALDAYAVDGKITRTEVEAAVKKYYKAASSDGMSFYGLFTSDTWNSGKYDTDDAVSSISLDPDKTTYVYVMVKNATAISTNTSNAEADTSNPQTGDGIVIALATMMSTGGAALALGKKKFF